MKEKSVLLVIDAQNDFHDQVPDAALAVPGATEDTKRIATFIKKVNPFSIFSSLDTHYSLDIAHSAWWTDAKGNLVSPFTLITVDDVENGKYVPRVDYKYSLNYLKELEANGEFQHFIWPEHCLQGTPGQALHPIYFAAIRDWMNQNMKWVNFIRKGENPYTEHFGIFRANVPVASDPSTNVNQGIFNTMNDHDKIYLAGQARTHCVANSLRQMTQLAPQLATKLVVLTDCMSDVAGLPTDFYNYVDSIYEDAKKLGVQFAKSTDI